MSALIIPFPRHRQHGPQDHAEGWRSDSCQACVLAYCETCKGGEGDLPTACPQRPMTVAERAAIYSGHLDHLLGSGWVLLRPLQSPLPHAEASDG